jgi:hypothetical protein
MGTEGVTGFNLWAIATKLGVSNQTVYNAAHALAELAAQVWARQ